MANRLPLPKDLQHLIEKRETEDRRQQERRETATPADTPAVPADEAAAAKVPARRKKADRRGTGRRKTDG